MDARVRSGAVALLGLAGAVTSAQAQAIDWSWDISDTAGNVGVVDVGESAILRLWASWAPASHGFAQAGPYGITGNAEWAAGTVDDFTNLLFFSSGWGTPGSGNSINTIENFQLSELFNPDYHAENPILLYSIEWTPDRYAGQFVTITNNAPDAYIYTDAVGTSVLYTGDPDCGTATFQVVPAPGTLALLGPALLALNRRRR